MADRHVAFVPVCVLSTALNAQPMWPWRLLLFFLFHFRLAFFTGAACFTCSGSSSRLAGSFRSRTRSGTWQRVQLSAKLRCMCFSPRSAGCKARPIDRYCKLWEHIELNFGRELLQDRMVQDVKLCPPEIMIMEREMAQFCQLSRLCTSMRLWEFPDQFIFEPVDGGLYQPLSIDRATGEPSLIEEKHVDQNAQTSTVFGIIGLIRLLAGTYILVITSRDDAGSYRGAPIFRVSTMRFLECNIALKDLTAQEKKDEVHFLSLLKTVESTTGLYFSYETDLTVNTQLSCKVKQQAQSLWKMADPRFLWNKHLLEELIEKKLEPYILPVIQGSYQTTQVLFGENIGNLSLLSRRCIQRIGTRMWRRGADLEGYAANFVETEQILEIDGFLASYVQVRGSIPVLWEQIADLTYKPKIRALCLDETPKVVERHFRDISKKYGSVIAVDLINQHGSEGVLSLAYANAMQNLVTDKLRYVQFDFHNICGHIHFERLSILYDLIKDDLSQQGFFLANPVGEIIQVQHGVVRTNCVDCLDRTNVTQSLLGRRVLEAQLQQLGIFKSSETIEHDSNSDEKFKHLWANHGDDISMQYSGTPALKGDFVRYGRRTVFGLIRDGFSAIARYFFNNFRDGVKQDAMDLVCGHYTVARNKPSPFKLNGFEAIAYLPFASALMLTGLTMTTFSLRQVGQDIYQFLHSVVWAGLTAGVMALVKANGRQFCNRPRLCNLH